MTNDDLEDENRGLRPLKVGGLKKSMGGGKSLRWEDEKIGRRSANANKIN